MSSLGRNTPPSFVVMSVSNVISSGDKAVFSEHISKESYKDAMKAGETLAKATPGLKVLIVQVLNILEAKPITTVQFINTIVEPK